MEAFIYILIVAILCCFLPYKRQKTASFFLLLFMMIMCGMRGYDVGIDTQGYVDNVVYLDDSDLRHGPIFMGLKYIANLFLNVGTAYLMMIAVLTYIPLLFIIENKSPAPAISVLMFIIATAIFFNESFNIIRQEMAIVYVLWGAVMLDEGKKVKALFLALLSVLIHPYTIIFILFFFLYRIELTKKKAFGLLALSVIIGMGAGSLSLIHDFLNLVSVFTSDSSVALVTRFSKYADGDIDANFSLVGQVVHIFPLTALCVLGANNKKILNNTFYKMMFWGCLLLNMVVSVTYCERISSTYTIAQLIAVPFMIKEFKDNSKVILYIVLFLTSVLYIYNFNQFIVNQQVWVPYHTFFN